MSIDEEIESMFTVPEKAEPVTGIFTSISAKPVRDTVFFKADDEDVDSVVIDDDAEVLEAQTRVAAAEKIKEDAEVATLARKELLPALTEEAEQLKKEIAALNSKLIAVNTKRAEATDGSYENRRALNTATRELDEAKRSVGIVRQNVIQRVKMQRGVEQFTRIASKMPWYNGFEVGDKIFKVLPHQWEGMQFLATAERAILGDEMGLGKTLCAIGALDLVGSKRALVIAPADTTSNFLKEVKRWAPHRTVVNIKGKSKQERNMIIEFAAHFEPVIVIVNYEAWRKDLSLLGRFKDFGFDTVIADEAHSVKNTRTDAFGGLEEIVLSDNVCALCGSMMPYNESGYRKCEKDGYTGGQYINTLTPHMTDHERSLLSKSVKNLWLMTGTAILNVPADLYPLLHLIDTHSFPYKNAFLHAYCEYNVDSSRYTFKPGGLNSLVIKLSGKYLARSLKSAGVVLPPQDIIYHNVEIQDDYQGQLDIIKQLTKYSQIILSETNKMSAIGVLALITRQRQANVWPGGIQIWEHPKDMYGQPLIELPKELVFDASEIKESIKIDKVMELIDEHVTEGGSRLAVFSQFKSGLAELERRLIESRVRVVRFDGDTPSALRDRIKTNFDKSEGETPEWDVVLCNYKTGGQGINLTAAIHTVILDEEWNPGKRDQAYARTHRIGQDEQTFVHVIRLTNTVDTWLADIIEEKEELINGFDKATVSIQEMLLEAIRNGAV